MRLVGVSGLVVLCLDVSTNYLFVVGARLANKVLAKEEPASRNSGTHKTPVVAPVE